MDKKLSEYTDLELAKAQGSQYQEFMKIQGNLIMINQEIEKRTPKVTVAEPTA
jgi:hypothetical protein